MDKLEPRFIAMLQERGIPEPVMLKLAVADCVDVPIYGNIGIDKKDVEAFLLAVIDVDPSQRPADYILKSKFITVWESCWSRIDVENQTTAERQLANLPPQIAPDDYEMAKRAFEASQGFQPGKFPSHLMPSQPFFERIINQVQTFFTFTDLTTVTNACQADSNTLNQMGIEPNGTFKIQKKEFGIPLPASSETLRNRIMVLGNAWVMVQMRFTSNPRISTVTQDMFTRYTNYLLGPQVWGMCAKGTDGRPIASPHITHVLAYDRAIRTLTATTVNAGIDMRTALEKALADDETRRLNFDIPFTHDSTNKMCTSLTAPGLSEIHPYLAVEPRGQKRQAAIDNAADPPHPPAGAGKRGKARKASVQRKNAEIDALKAQLSNRQTDRGTRGNGGGNVKGGGKDRGRGNGNGRGNGGGSQGGSQGQGAGLAGRLGLPAGAKLKTADGKNICAKYSKGVS